jgi:sulfur-oxidizing protein SoxX
MQGIKRVSHASFCLMVNKNRDTLVSGWKNTHRARIVLAGFLVLLTSVSAAQPVNSIAAGKSLVMERSKGNCLACHVVEDGKQAGNIGPPLIGMKLRFPDSKVLYRQIWDAAERNPDTRMPPFGRHGILSEEDIGLVIEYLYTL